MEARPSTHASMLSNMHVGGRAFFLRIFIFSERKRIHACHSEQSQDRTYKYTPFHLSPHACVIYAYYTHTSHAHKPHPLITPPSTAVSRHACGRPRRGAVAAVLPHWDDDDRLPGGRLTRALPPPANGHDRGAWCERRNRTASARWAPTLPGQPASRLHWHAFVRAAFDNFGSDRRGLRARHADTHSVEHLRGARPQSAPFALNRSATAAT